MANVHVFCTYNFIYSHRLRVIIDIKVASIFNVKFKKIIIRTANWLKSGGAVLATA